MHTVFPHPFLYLRKLSFFLICFPEMFPIFPSVTLQSKHTELSLFRSWWTSLCFGHCWSLFIFGNYPLTLWVTTNPWFSKFHAIFWDSSCFFYTVVVSSVENFTTVSAILNSYTQNCHMTQQSHSWAYTPRKPDLKEICAPQCSSQHCL